MSTTTTASRGRPRPGLAQRILRSRTLAALAQPHGVDRYLELIDPMWAAHEVRARIVDVHREVDVPGHPPVATLTLQPTSTWQGHRAGQHVQLGVEIDGARRTTRVFTISSPDSRPGDRFTVTMRANPDAPPGRSVSRHLTERAAVGTTVHLSQAQGGFVLPDRVPEHVVMISGGSGITPVMSMLRSLQRRTHRGQVTFIHYAQSPEHQIFASELADVAASGNGIDLHLLHPELGDPSLSPAWLERTVPGYRHVPTWACGPAPLMEAVHGAYARPGEARNEPSPRDGSEALHVEYFKPPRAGGGNAGGEVTFARSGTSAPNTGESLLAQAEALGLRPESGCRMGICFSCVSRKPEGTVRDVVSGVESSLPDEEIRVCVSAPVGDCTVDL